jgi:hypothetical protein
LVDPTKTSKKEKSTMTDPVRIDYDLVVGDDEEYGSIFVSSLFPYYRASLFCKDELNDVVSAAKNLLDFVRQKYPDDFKPGGKGFVCPYHIALDKALSNFDHRRGEVQ